MNAADSFDAKAATWDDDPMRRRRAATVADAIAGEISLHDRMRVLDFGCGTGLLGRQWLGTVGEVVFADPSSGMREEVLRRLEEEGGTAATRVVDPAALEEHAPFDLVASLMALHHVRDVEATIDRLGRCLSAGGWLALSDLDREDGSFHRQDEGFVHQGFERTELEAILRSVGLTPRRSRTAFTIEKEIEGEPRRYPVFLILAQS